MSCNTSTYNLGVVGILLGKDTYQETCIVTKADASSSLQNKYFVMHEPVTYAKHYFWYEVGGSGGVDPLVPNSTGHKISVATNATANAVASATNTVIDGLAWAGSTVDGNHISVTFTTYGYAYEARDTLVDAAKTTFTITVTKFGSVQVDLGSTNGDTSFTVEEQTVEINSPQTGDFILEEIRRGATCKVGFELKDTSEASVRRALAFYGTTVVTDDSASATLTGYGSKNLFKSTSDVATQIILRPLKFIADATPDEDFTLHKAKLKLGAITFSAENELVLPIEAVGYLDTSKSGFGNLFTYGDGSKLPDA